MITPQLYISGYEADISEIDPIVIDYSISDIKDPATRKVSASKSINLPGTANNDFIFKQLFILGKDNNYTTFNPNLKAVAFVQVGSSVVLEGYLQLLEINNTNNGHTYTCVIYETGKNLFSEMGDKFLQGNTTSADNVDLENGTTALTYQYGATEYSKATANGFVASSNVAALFPIDSGTNVTNSAYPYYSIPYTNLRMAMKFKHIWDRIFAKYGTTYSSTFLNSTFFKSMVYMDTHKTANLTSAQRNQIIVSANRSSDIAYTNGAFIVNFNNELQDIGNRYNTTTGIYTAPSNRDYNIVVNMLAHSRLRVASGPVTFSGTNIIEVESRVRFRKNGVPLPTSNGIKQSITITAGTYPVGTTWEFTLGGPNTYTIPFEITWDAQIGDTIDVTIETTIVNSSLYPGLTSDVKVLTSSTLLINPATNNLSAGEIYNKNSVPASQHKQKDFIMDIIRMFNLYLLWDGVNYVIEPRDTFYQLGTTLDWTDKVDRTSGINIKPVGQLTWKQLQFIAKKDADYYSDKYFTDTKEVYGQQNVLNGNEFVTETKKIELTFAPPLSVSSAANYPKLQHMYKLNNGVAEAIDGLPRYGYWAGWVEENTVFKRITGLGNVDYNGYAYVGEFNNPTAPTLSVLFGPPREVFYQTFGVLAITDTDLYTNYYSNDLLNQTNLNAKIVTCKVKLTPNDINNLKLYQKVIVDGVLFIISKINAYNTATQEPVDVELIQFES